MTRNILLTAIMLLSSMMAIAQSWSKDLEKAAKKGDETSQLAVANAYFNGNGVNADKAKAAQWYYKATLGDNAEAKAKLYSFYSKELEKFAKSGDAQAQYEVGMDYFEGAEVAKNTETAAKWFQLATNQNHKEAKAKLYSFYSKELEKLAKTDAEAMYYVGCYYFDGNGIAKNEKKGFDYLKKALDNGHSPALDKMGASWSKLLKNEGERYKNLDITYALANCYYDGRGVEKDIEKAAYYYERAMLKGHKKSKDKFYSFESERRVKRQKKTEIIGYVNGDRNCPVKIEGDPLSSEGVTFSVWGEREIKGAKVSISTDEKNEILKHYQSEYRNRKNIICIDNTNHQGDNVFVGKIYFVLSQYYETNNKIMNINSSIEKFYGAGYKVNMTTKYTKSNFSYTLTDRLIHEQKINSPDTTFTFYSEKPQVMDEIEGIKLPSPMEVMVKEKLKAKRSVGLDYPSLKNVTYYFNNGDSIMFDVGGIREFHITSKDGIKCTPGEVGVIYTYPNGKYFRSYYYKDKDGKISKSKSEQELIEACFEMDEETADFIFKNSPDSYTKDGACYYGMIEKEYREYQRRESEKARQARLKEMYDYIEKEYGRKQVNVVKNSSTIFTKGINIHLLSELCRASGSGLTFHKDMSYNGITIYYCKGYGEYAYKLWVKNDIVIDILEY